MIKDKFRLVLQEIQCWKVKNRRIFRILISVLLILPLLFGWMTPPPKGTSYISSPSSVSDIRLLYDLTYTKNDALIHDQNILNEQLKMIDEAKEFIVADLFLYNDYYNTEKYEFPHTTQKLTNAIIEKKKKSKDIKVYVITDEINNSYSSKMNRQFQQMEDNGIEVIITDLSKVRDSNPIYSGYYRTYIAPFGLNGSGWIQNPFGDNGPDVTIRNYLRLLNFKANHRKVLITDQSAMVSSANPHDGSAYHSNIAFQFSGEAVKSLLEAEKAVALFSGTEIKDIEYNLQSREALSETQVLILTENKIRDEILENIESAGQGNSIYIGMFYLSHREVIKQLIEASKRGASVKIILDPNKDAFGYEKSGIPNRQAAAELLKKSGNRIQIRWYHTHGEQYHAKIFAVYKDEEAVLIGGSANYTRRNLDNYNLEADLMVTVKREDPLAEDFEAYFHRIWFNQDGTYTADYTEYMDDSIFRIMIYRFQEWTGLSTF
ncbi:phospholipase D family protein [Sinanaerobacter chloroacetimidivorans]|uniref:phospholipase D n=1 Tax=Sinanaerobacter chloroacetimidivorans TaxID=2818044 RepID=A0A8J7W6F3_9FIRM|nr:phospholipase D family protein [Sinanaerobacter chloroacetimidivorans]MBR0600193.1 phospholipase D family protein [Sinanaerobacter chloroacetimidivorans]